MELARTRLEMARAALRVMAGVTSPTEFLSDQNIDHIQASA
jgi:hypothetical protein